MQDKKSLYLDTFHIMFERCFHRSTEENEDGFSDKGQRVEGVRSCDCVNCVDIYSDWQNDNGAAQYSEHTLLYFYSVHSSSAPLTMGIHLNH